MLRIITVALLLGVQREATAGPPSPVSLADLRKINETCPGDEFCEDSRDTAKISIAKCVCNEDCARFGDCCRDSPFFQPKQVATHPYKCVEQATAGYHYYMITQCPSHASPAQRKLCEHPQQSPDPMTDNVPVTIRAPDGVMTTYLNTHCARCNNAKLSSGKLWVPVLEFPDVIPSFSIEDIKLNWNETLQRWQIRFNKHLYPCNITFKVPDDLMRSLRMCRLGAFVEECLDKWQGSYEEQLCHSYTAILNVNSTRYRNIYCALCNDQNTADAVCVEFTYRGAGAFQTFTILLKDPEKEKMCESRMEIYDAIFDKCRNILCPAGKDDCSFSNFNKTVSKGSLSNKIDSCTRIVLEKGTFELKDDQLWVPKYSRNYTEGEFLVNKDGNVEICTQDLPAPPIDKYSFIMGVITVVGLGLSIIFIVLHLCAVALVPELRNHSGMNLASLCVALLGAYISFIMGGVLKDQGDPNACFRIAFFIYYFFISAFVWMLVLAFDVWRVLRGAVKHFRSSHGRQWCRFLFYSILGWGIPALLTVVTLVVEKAPRGQVDDRLRPRFGEYNCWFSQRLPLIVFFAMPLAVIMVLNVILFASSAFMATETRSAPASVSNAGHRKDYRLFLRLAILLGMTWVLGLMASILDYEILWIAFLLFNTLQGLFIFVAFTCTPKVLDSLTKRFPWANRVRRSLKLPPSKPAAMAPSDTGLSQSTSESTLKSSSNNMTVDTSRQAETSPSDVTDKPRTAPVVISK